MAQQGIICHGYLTKGWVKSMYDQMKRDVLRHDMALQGLICHGCLTKSCVK